MELRFHHHHSAGKKDLGHLLTGSEISQGKTWPRGGQGESKRDEGKLNKQEKRH
jgi:hypothetical protein